MAYSDKLRIKPVVKNLTGDPLVVSLSPGSPLLDFVDVHDQRAFQNLLDEWMKGHYTFGLASYLENRETVLSRYPQMAVSGYESGDGNYGASYSSHP